MFRERGPRTKAAKTFSAQEAHAGQQIFLLVMSEPAGSTVGAADAAEDSLVDPPSHTCLAIFWDVENVRPPPGMVDQVATRLRKTVSIFGPILSFKAYLGEPDTLSQSQQMTLQGGGVSLVYCPHRA